MRQGIAVDLTKTPRSGELAPTMVAQVVHLSQLRMDEGNTRSEPLLTSPEDQP